MKSVFEFPKSDSLPNRLFDAGVIVGCTVIEARSEFIRRNCNIASIMDWERAAILKRYMIQVRCVDLNLPKYCRRLQLHPFYRELRAFLQIFNLGPVREIGIRATRALRR